MTLPDTSTLADFGGPLKNYLADPVDPATDADASAWNTIACNTAMMSHTMPLCRLVFVGDPRGPQKIDFEAVWKEKTPNMPVGARLSTGIYTFTFPAAVLDELGGSHTLSLGGAFASVSGPNLFHANADAAGNVITVRVFAPLSSTPSDGTDTKFSVWAYRNAPVPQPVAP